MYTDSDYLMLVVTLTQKELRSFRRMVSQLMRMGVERETAVRMICSVLQERAQRYGRRIA